MMVCFVPGLRRSTGLGPVASLAPGATAHFDTTFEHPSITATGVAVTFAAQ